MKTRLYRTAEEARLLALDIAAPPRRELFLEGLRHRLVPTEPCHDAAARLPATSTPSTPPPHEQI